jgi:predicted NBD/HSP70 family sugar kinase
VSAPPDARRGEGHRNEVYRGEGHRGEGHRNAGGPASQQGMRRANLALVLGAVARLGTTSRAQVADATGLTRAAAGSLVNELIYAGLVLERGASLEGRVGRPSTVLSLNDRGPAGLGLEVGVEHLGACVVDLGTEVRTRIRVPAPNRGRDPHAAIEQLAEVATRALGEAAGQGLTPVAVAVAVPGLVGGKGGAAAPDATAHETFDTVVHAPNLGWHDVRLADELRTLFPAALRDLPIEVANEANLGALAELWRGEVGRDFVHVSAEAGIGAAVVVDGMLLRGRRGFAGELGHMPVYPDGLPCPCGSHGCLEQYAGEEAVLSACGLRNEGGDRVALLAAEARTENVAVRRALDRAGRALGIALSGAVNLVDPETVVLGGAYADLAAWLTPGMQTELGARVKIRPWEPAGLVVSGLKREGPVVGAATSVVQRVIADPSSVAAG